MLHIHPKVFMQSQSAFQWTITNLQKDDMGKIKCLSSDVML